MTGGGGGWVIGGGEGWVIGGEGGRFSRGAVGVSLFLKNISLEEYNMLSGTRIGGRFSIAYR